MHKAQIYSPPPYNKMTNVISIVSTKPSVESRHSLGWVGLCVPDKETQQNGNIKFEQKPGWNW